MVYTYKCDNECCGAFKKVVEVNKPMSDVSRDELCKCCDTVMTKVFNTTAIKTGDGVKR